MEADRWPALDRRLQVVLVRGEEDGIVGDPSIQWSNSLVIIPGLEEEDARLRSSMRLERVSVQADDRQDTPAVAKGVFEGLSAEESGDIRALRIAKLDLADEYDPETHDRYFRTFAWSAEPAR